MKYNVFELYLLAWIVFSSKITANRAKYNFTF